MGLRVNTNIISLTAHRHLANVTGRLEGNYQHLASGLRIASAAVQFSVLGSIDPFDSGRMIPTATSPARKSPVL